ncbi:MAG: DNA repair protein RecO [Phycisphaeraceae bacterium]|nr:MAG: DNA repair protein RecO [Phycisphaeraceae bacterium]
MPTIRDQAIVLRTWDFSETSQTVALFCREHGSLRGLAKGSLRDKAPYSGGFEPLTAGEVIAIVKPTTELATITEWDLQRIYRAPRTDLRAHYAALYLIDLVHNFITDADPHPRVFDMLDGALVAAEAGDGVAAGLLALQWTLLDEAGYRPRLDLDVKTGQRLSGKRLGFDPERGGLTGDSGPEWRVRPETGEVLSVLEATSSPLEVVKGMEMVSVERAGRLLAAYFRHLLQRDLPTRALAFPSLGGRIEDSPKGARVLP